MKKAKAEQVFEEELVRWIKQRLEAKGLKVKGVYFGHTAVYPLSPSKYGVMLRIMVEEECWKGCCVWEDPNSELDVIDSVAAYLDKVETEEFGLH